jgi:hypothetical protein
MPNLARVIVSLDGKRWWAPSKFAIGNLRPWATMKAMSRPVRTFIAALGLAFGCAPGAIGTSSDAGTTGDGDGDPSTSGDGDPSTTGDGDGEPILQAGTDSPSGFVRCEDGFVHRVEAVEAINPTPADHLGCAAGRDWCQTGADCVAKPHGACRAEGVGENTRTCDCVYGCATDADCNPGHVCASAGVVGERATCIAATCDTDAACGDGLCGVSVYPQCCGVAIRIGCADPDDCHVDSDCGDELCSPNSPQMIDECVLGVSGTDWTCMPGLCGCTCG